MTLRIPVLLALGLLLTAIQSPVNGQCEKDCTQKRVYWAAGSWRQGVVQEYSDQGTLNY